MDGKEVYQLTETLKCPFYGGLCVCACVCWISRDILVFHLELRFPFIGLLKVMVGELPNGDGLKKRNIGFGLSFFCALEMF